MASLRLFIAARLPADVAASVTTLKQAWPHVRWSHDDQLHVTLRFLGDTDEGAIPPLTARLSSLELPFFEARLHGVGTFPDASPAPTRAPRVLWVGLAPASRWQELKQAVDGALGPDPACVARPFTPHLTFARVGPRIPSDEKEVLRRALVSFVQANATFTSPSWTVAGLDLVQSTLRPSGAEHRTLTSFPFRERA